MSKELAPSEDTDRGQSPPPRHLKLDPTESRGEFAMVDPVNSDGAAVASAVARRNQASEWP